MPGERIATAALLAAAALLVLWIRLLPLGLPRVPDRAEALVRQRLAAERAVELPATVSAAERPGRTRQAVDAWVAAHPAEYARQVEVESERLGAQLRADGAGGRSYVLLGDLDSYFWLRQARARLCSGAECAPVDSDHDPFTLAPVGMKRRTGSLHVSAIAAVHRIASLVDPAQPLPLSAFWVPVVVGVLGVVPAFAIGRRLAGPVGGFFAAVFSALHPVMLQRSMGSDNDVWNVVLPLFMAWALIAALTATRRAAQVAGAIAAGAVAGLHAATWRGWTFAFVILLTGLAGTAVLHALRSRLQSSEEERAWLRTTVIVGVIYYFATALGAALIGSDPSVLSIPLDAVSFLWATFVPPAAPVAGGGLAWPAALDTVGELWVPNLGSIAGYSYGALLFFVGWIGLLVLFLPRADWQVGHFLVLIGGTLLYRYLLTAQLDRPVLLALLALPLAVAGALSAAAARDADTPQRGTAVLVAVWFVAALYFSFNAMRFILLLAAPFGLAAGTAVGRLHLWLDAEAARQSWVPAAPARALVGLALAALVVMPARNGYSTAAAYVPAIDRAWVDSLERLRATTAPDAIVNAWWDYGYWIAYYGERRVSADGGTLLTHVPHWLARAQLAPSESESVGLLRMLNCGSDATPFDENGQGAFAKLRGYGVDDRAAAVTVGRLASLSRAAATELLAGLGLNDAARGDVLSATHCTPPESYLMLTTDQAVMQGWWSQGTWDPDGSASSESSPAFSRGFVTREWVSCAPAARGELRCPVGQAVGDGRRIEAVIYRDGAPGQAALEVLAGGQPEPSRAVPPLVLVAGPQALEQIEPPAGDPAQPVVLIDTVGARVLVGSVKALRSTYTALLHLDGRYVRHFHKVDDRTGYRGQRVVTWRIDWPPT
jgi:hypothetical protein